METPSTKEINQASQELIKSYQKALTVLIENHNKDPEANLKDMMNIAQIYQQWWGELFQEPKKLWDAQSLWLKEAMEVFQQYQEKMNGKKITPKLQPSSRDRRFNLPQWQEKPWFYFVQQMYLLLAKHCAEFVEKNPSKDPKIAKQVAFFTQQFLDAISPTNFIFTNPEVLQHTIDSKGENLTKGFKNFLDDIVRGQGHFMIKMTDMTAFEVGKNVAITQGKVIFRNRMIELIQYDPTTEEVYKRPLLMVPPWINKYYILDLRERNSFVKWAVDQGFTVFIISWVNPDDNYRNTEFADYMLEGILAALDNIEKATGESNINVLGFCVGGTLLAATLAYMKAKHDKRIHSATFLTTLIDFSDPGDIQVFIDEPQIQAMEMRMDTEGYLDGRLIMNSFNLLRANDLLWSYYINNYLFGNDPLPFDLLFWNADSTNLPKKMHSYYLRNMYLNDLLIHGGCILDNQPLDLSKITTPCYFMSTEHDHIAPWKTTFKGAQAFKGKNTFVLAGSGHIAGVINPPVNNKYDYHTTDQDPKHYKNADEWFENSQSNPGSWWTHWGQWLAKMSGEKVVARTPGENTPILEDAPGSYVRRRIV